MNARSTNPRPTKPRGNSTGLSRSSVGSYFTDSQRPLTILAFLFPLVIVYELGSHLYRHDVIAFRLLQRPAQWISVYGSGVPAVLLAFTLIIWHVARQDRWRVSISTLLLMLFESVVMALPVMIIAVLVIRFLPNLPRLPLMAGTGQSMGAMWVLSIGAGIYEELVFRFYGCGALRLLMERGMGMKKPWSTLWIVLVSSILFSLYHYLGNEPPTWHSFVFRTVAGAYFATLFLFRGLGISAGAHAVYDIIIVTLHGM